MAECKYYKPKYYDFRSIIEDNKQTKYYFEGMFYSAFNILGAISLGALAALSPPTAQSDRADAIVLAIVLNSPLVLQLSAYALGYQELEGHINDAKHYFIDKTVCTLITNDIESIDAWWYSTMPFYNNEL